VYYYLWCCHGLILYEFVPGDLGIEVVNEGDDLHLGGFHIALGLLLAMHPVVEVEVAIGIDEYPVDGKATPDAEGDVAVGVFLISGLRDLARTRAEFEVDAFP